MSTPRVDALEVIYEDDDEGAVSSNGSDEDDDYEDDDRHTSLHGHPDHLHSGENGEGRVSEKKILQTLRAENKQLRSHLTVLAREVERADTELARWRARYRKIEDERDTLKREFNKLALVSKSQESISGGSSRPSKYTVAYSADAESSESTGSSQLQKSNNTEHIASILSGSTHSQESPGIPVHRGRLRQQSVPPDTLRNTYETRSEEPTRHSSGELNNLNGPLLTRPLNSEALPFSPSWLGPKVPAKEGYIPMNGKHDNVNDRNYNVSPIPSELLANKKAILHSSNPLKPPPKDGISPLTPEGRFVSSPGLRTTSSPGVIPVSRQTSPPTSSVVQPIQPPRQNSADSLGRSASTASTLSNSSSHTSNASSSVSPSSSQPISPTPYSPNKRINALTNQPSLELIPPVIAPDGYQSGALVQTLRGRAKDILEGRASPGMVRPQERSSLAQLPDALVPIYPEHTLLNRVDGAADSQTTAIYPNLVTRNSHVPWVDDIRSTPSVTDDTVTFHPEDRRAEPKLSSRNHNNYNNSNIKGKLHNVENVNSGSADSIRSAISNGFASRPNEFNSSSLGTNFSMANAAFQEHIDLNHDNNLMVDLFVKSKYPYTNTNTQVLSTNEENGYMHSAPQLQFIRTLTPGSNNPSGLPAPINGAPLFNIPTTNRNAISTQSAHVGLSTNMLPVDVRPFLPDSVASSTSRIVPSMSRILSTAVRSPSFTPFPLVPVLQDDPEYGPVIVHGPLPPRHHQHGHGTHSSARRKREPANVPPRHLGLPTNASVSGAGTKRTGTRQDFEGGPSSGVSYGW